MKKAKTYAGVERERESYTLINNNQAKKFSFIKHIKGRL